MSLVGAIPRWAKLAAHELAAMTAVEKRDVIVLSIVPPEGTEPAVSSSFSLDAYANDPDECWRQALSLLKGSEA